MTTRHSGAYRYGLLAVLISLAGCTVGPDFKPPHPAVPTEWSALTSDSGPPPASRVDAQKAQIARWWRVFDDPNLTALVRQALADNLDLKQATQRIREARARLAVVSGQDYPELNAKGSYTRRHISQNGIISAMPGPPIPGSALSDIELYQAGFDASWEIDLFGLNRRQSEAARARWQASVEGRRGVRVSLTAEVARNYMILRGAQDQLAVTRQALHTRQVSLHLIEAKYRAGLAAQAAVQRARAGLDKTRARIPPLQTSARQAIHRLAVLLGRPPGALPDSLSDPGDLPPVPKDIPIGLPSTLLRRRPDIRRAEKQLHAATADIGVAVAKLFPQFSITGKAGFQSTEFDQLSDWGSRFFGIGPSLTLPIFEGGRLRANVRVKKAQHMQALLAYRQTVLTALREVADAIVAYRNIQHQQHALTRAVHANDKALTNTQERYRHGLTDYLAVLDSQRALLQSRAAQAQGRQKMRTRLVALYKALGGGWTRPGAASAALDGDDKADPHP